jgi:PadR family transcriptional regulator, regulatory protein PadR
VAQHGNASMAHFPLVLGANFNYAVEEMSGTPSLGEFEQVVLLAILRLGDDAYGVTIRDEIRKRTDREPTPGALYTTLDRLEDKGLVTSRMGDPTPQRGGRAKRFFRVSAIGVEAVARAQRSYRRLLEGLKLPGVASA